MHNRLQDTKGWGIVNRELALSSKLAAESYELWAASYEIYGLNVYYNSDNRMPDFIQEPGDTSILSINLTSFK